jgi:hypothetical protein
MVMGISLPKFRFSLDGLINNLIIHVIKSLGYKYDLTVSGLPFMDMYSPLIQSLRKFPIAKCASKGKCGPKNAKSLGLEQFISPLL